MGKKNEQQTAQRRNAEPKRKRYVAMNQKVRNKIKRLQKRLRVHTKDQSAITRLKELRSVIFNPDA